MRPLTCSPVIIYTDTTCLELPHIGHAPNVGHVDQEPHRLVSE
jgi:hypothetical protein